MDLKKIQGLESPTATTNPTPRATTPNAGGASFRETLQKVQTGMEAPGAPGAKSIDGVRFSNHAVDRMRTRGIMFSPEDLGRLSQAVDRAAAKGSKDSLILMNDSALIVSVKNKTVVTVMDKNALKENVFTNIDSTIVM